MGKRRINRRRDTSPVRRDTDSHLAVVGGRAALDGTLCALTTVSGRVRVGVVVVEMGMVLVGTVEGER